MIYPSLNDYHEFIFDTIRSLGYDDASKPIYEKDKGLNQLQALLERIQSRYYPGYYTKAAYFFLALSTGHYFENGNKRIALFSYLFFHEINGYKFNGLKKETYKQWFKKNFPSYTLNKAQFKSNVGWALYNFNKAINIKLDSHKNGHNYDFEEQKDITKEFLQLISRKK